MFSFLRFGVLSLSSTVQPCFHSGECCAVHPRIEQTNTEKKEQERKKENETTTDFYEKKMSDVRFNEEKISTEKNDDSRFEERKSKTSHFSERDSMYEKRMNHDTYQNEKTEMNQKERTEKETGNGEEMENIARKKKEQTELKIEKNSKIMKIENYEPKKGNLSGSILLNTDLLVGGWNANDIMSSNGIGLLKNDAESLHQQLTSSPVVQKTVTESIDELIGVKKSGSEKEIVSPRGRRMSGKKVFTFSSLHQTPLISVSSELIAQLAPEVSSNQLNFKQPSEAGRSLLTALSLERQLSPAENPFSLDFAKSSLESNSKLDTLAGAAVNDVTFSFDFGLDAAKSADTLFPASPSLVRPALYFNKPFFNGNSVPFSFNQVNSFESSTPKVAAFANFVSGERNAASVLNGDACSDVKLSPRLLNHIHATEGSLELTFEKDIMQRAGTERGALKRLPVQVGDNDASNVSTILQRSTAIHDLHPGENAFSAFATLQDAPEVSAIDDEPVFDEFNSYSYFYQLAMHSPFGVPVSLKKAPTTFFLPRYLPNTANGLDHSLWSVQGCRDHMEDRHRILYDFGVELADENGSVPVMVNGFFGVFDGHSGWMASQYAAQFLPDCIFAHLQRIQLEQSSSIVNWSSVLPICIKRAFDQLEFEILRHSNQFKHDAGSTAVCTVIVDGSIYCANTGDSRCVLARRLPLHSDCDNSTHTFSTDPCEPRPAKQEQGVPKPPPHCAIKKPFSFDAESFLNQFTAPVSILQTTPEELCSEESPFILNAIDLSSDHKPNRPDERQRVYAAGGAVSANTHTEKWCLIFSKDVEGPLRVRPGNLSLSRTLGDLSNKLPNEPEVIIHDCELSITKVDSSCLFLIFGSDGLWDVMSSQDAVDYVYRKITEHKVPHREVAKKLVQRALDLGSKDNLTVLIVFFAHW